MRLFPFFLFVIQVLNRLICNDLEKALSVPNTDVRLFGKFEAFLNRRMGVALAIADSADTARKNAAQAANMVVITTN